MNKGKFVVIDGTDGSGKGTQLNLLSKKLRHLKIPFKTIDFPRYSDNAYGKLAGRYLKGEFGGIKFVSPYLASLAFAGDRLLAKPLIDEWLNKGFLVISNRYASSNKAHMSANIEPGKRKEFMDWLDNLEYKTNKLPRPDLTIFLYVTPEIGQQNVDSKKIREYLEDEKRDILEKDLKHLQDSSEVYLYLSKTEPNWKVINCMSEGKMRSREEIHKEILKVLNKDKILKNG
ncbi:hypothetical protein HYS91_02360 [Candidatus Daviesbacteria bacterium]|nr:hypothetical protein [Candidatus Daviesbacteria bacterium]